MNNKALIFSGLLFATLLLFACGGQRKDEGEEAKQYDLLTITASDHELTTEYAASLKGQQDIRIIPRIEGYLQGIYVKEGQHVKEGQLLFVAGSQQKGLEQHGELVSTILHLVVESTAPFFLCETQYYYCRSVKCFFIACHTWKIISQYHITIIYKQ